MELGDAVDGVGADDAEVGHAHMGVVALLDDGHALTQCLVGGVVDMDLSLEAPVDLLDQLKVSWQQAPEQAHRPALERLGQQGVVGVGDGGSGDLPGLVPVQLLEVDQHAHQLGDGDGGVGVVELHRHLVGERVEGVVLLLVGAEDVGDGAGHEEVLLLEAQLLALGGVVLGVQHLGDAFGDGAALDGAAVVAVVEHGEVGLFGGAGGPEPQGVDRVVVGAEAGDGCVVGHAEHGGAGGPVGLEASAGVLEVLDVAAEAHVHGVLGSDDLPGVALAEPLVGLLHLVTVADLLVEDAKLVADAVSDGGKLEVAR